MDCGAGLSRLGLPWRVVKKKKVAVVGVGFILVGVLLLSFLSTPSRLDLQAQVSKDCKFPAIFNFGDSNSDTGTASAAFARVPFPNGITFFGTPSGRYCDGRLIIDFLAEELGMPYLSAYLDSTGANFRHGVNYAASGTTIQLTDANLYGAGFNPLSLSVQLSQFEQFTARTRELYNQTKTSSNKNSLPNPVDFSRALYTLDIGQNDIHFALTTMTDEQVQAFILSIIDRFSSSIEKLYKHGARTFWIHNTGPIGCLPAFVIPHPPKSSDADHSGCITSYNQVAQQFNSQLKGRVTRLRDQLQEASIIYVDIYSAKYSLISNAKKYGFPHPLENCCGKIGIVECWSNEMVNGSEVHGISFNDPSIYISWDGIHYTEAANKWISSRILDGSFSDPKVSVTEACHKLSPPPY